MKTQERAPFSHLCSARCPNAPLDIRLLKHRTIYRYAENSPAAHDKVIAAVRLFHNQTYQLWPLHLTTASTIQYLSSIPLSYNICLDGFIIMQLSQARYNEQYNTMLIPVRVYSILESNNVPIKPPCRCLWCYSKRIPSPAIAAAASSSPESNRSLLARFVPFALLIDNVLDDPVITGLVPVVVNMLEGVTVLNANTDEMLLACSASSFAPHGLALPAIPGCGHPVQFFTMPICPAKVGQLLVKSGEAPPSSTVVKLIEPWAGIPPPIRRIVSLIGVQFDMLYDHPSVHFPAGNTRGIPLGEVLEFTTMKGSEGGDGGLYTFSPTYTNPSAEVSRPDDPSSSKKMPVMFQSKSKPKPHAAAAFWMTKITGKGLTRVYVWLSGKTRSISIVVGRVIESADNIDTAQERIHSR